MWDKVKSLVSQSAPLLGGLIGGPFGSAIGLIASSLGTDESPEAIEQAIRNDPEAALKLRTCQENNRAMLQRITLELEHAKFTENHQTYRTELKQDDLYTKRWRPTLGYALTFSWVITWLAIAYTIMFKTAQAQEIITALVNTSVLWGVALGVLGVNVHSRSQDKKLSAGTSTPGMLDTLKNLVGGKSS